MIKYKLIITLLFFSTITIAQKSDTLTLDYCHDLAIKNFPIAKKKGLYLKKNELAIKNIKKNYLPQLNLNAQATYQSDVTSIPLDFSQIKVEIPNQPISPSITAPDMPEVAKDQYKVSLDINQVIYDGGFTKNQKKIEKINLLINNQNVDVELYSLKGNLNDVFLHFFYFRKMKSSLKLRFPRLKLN